MDDALHTVTARAQHPLHPAGLLGIALCLMVIVAVWPMRSSVAGPGPRPQQVLATGCTPVPLLDRCRALLPAPLRELPPIEAYVAWRVQTQHFEPLDPPDPRPDSPDAHWSPPSLPRPDLPLHPDPIESLRQEVAIRDWSSELPPPLPGVFAPPSEPAVGALTDDSHNIELYTHLARLQREQLEAVGRARRVWRDTVHRDEARRRSKAMTQLWNQHDLRSSQAQLAWLRRSANHHRQLRTRQAAAVTVPTLGVLMLLFAGLALHTRPRRIRITARTLSIDGRRFPLHDICSEFWEDKRCPGIELRGGYRLGLHGYRLPIEAAWDLSDATRSGIRSTSDSKAQPDDRRAVQVLAFAD